MDLLARREHSDLELRRKLRQKGFESEQIEQVIVQLIDERLLSNERFTEEFVRSRASRGFGPLKIRVELSDLGISDEMIQAALSVLPENFWRYQLEALWRKKYAGRVESSVQAKAKCVRYLQYKGFPSQDIFQLINERLSDE